MIATKRQTLIYTEVSDLVQVPRDKLFDFMTDTSNWRKIYPNVASVTPKENEYGETLLEITESDGEVYTVEQRFRRPDKLVRVIRRRAIEGLATYAFKPVSEGTLVTFVFQMKFRGFLKFLTPFVTGIEREHMRNVYFDHPKRIAEAEFQIDSNNDQAKGGIRLP